MYNLDTPWKSCPKFRLRCSICLRQFHMMHHLKNHMRTHRAERPFQQLKYPSKSGQGGNLKRHSTLNHRARTEKSLGSCHVTNLKLPDEPQTCQTVELSNTEKFAKRGKSVIYSFVCTVCSKSFPTTGNLLRHMKMIHQEPAMGRRSVRGIHVCPLCNEHFLTSKMKLHHCKMHFEKAIVCQACGRDCATPWQLASHIIRDHNSSRECGKCKKVFAHRSAMSKHIRCFRCPVLRAELASMHVKDIGALIYPRIPKWICGVCARNCSGEAELKRHARVHQGEKPFACTSCGKGFNFQANLTKHVRFVHNREKRPPTKERSKRNACTLCPSSFASPKDLEVHMRKHTGDKPFRCPQCEMTFSQKGNMNTHIKRKHSGEPRRPGRKCVELDSPSHAVSTRVQVEPSSGQCKEQSEKHHVFESNFGARESPVYSGGAFHKFKLSKPHQNSTLDSAHIVTSNEEQHQSIPVGHVESLPLIVRTEPLSFWPMSICMASDTVYAPNMTLSEEGIDASNAYQVQMFVEDQSLVDVASKVFENFSANGSENLATLELFNAFESRTATVQPSAPSSNCVRQDAGPHNADLVYVPHGGLNQLNSEDPVIQWEQFVSPNLIMPVVQSRRDACSTPMSNGHSTVGMVYGAMNSGCVVDSIASTADLNISHAGNHLSQATGDLIDRPEKLQSMEVLLSPVVPFEKPRELLQSTGASSNGVCRNLSDFGSVLNPDPSSADLRRPAIRLPSHCTLNSGPFIPAQSFTTSQGATPSQEQPTRIVSFSSCLNYRLPVPNVYALSSPMHVSMPDSEPPSFQMFMISADDLSSVNGLGDLPVHQ